MDYGDRKETFSFLLQGYFHYYRELAVCFLRSNGELGKYSREKSLIKEKYIRNQRESFPIGPMLTRSGNVYVIKTQFHLQRPYCQPGNTPSELKLRWPSG